ncbi:MAG TPA: fatty acid desaturase [Macromonas sp.]|nr:fatty acid desaturase [Macromonas sp.]
MNDPRYQEVMRVPVVSVPQWTLSLVALVSFAGSTWAYMADVLPLWAAMFINFVAVYLSFTPLHDASHRAVSKSSFLNDAIGTVVGQLLMPGMNMDVFRTIHMDHHRFLGQIGRDPDTSLVDLGFWGLPKLMFVDVVWSIFYLQYGRKYWAKSKAISFGLLLVADVGIHVAFLASPFWLEFLLLFVIPQRVGLGFVAYVFAHIQHPHGLTWENEPFQSTVFIRGESVLRKLMCGQQDHIIHHLLPHVPWFKYARVWDLANKVLREQNVPSRNAFVGLKSEEMPEQLDIKPIAMRLVATREVGEDIRAFSFEPVDGCELRNGSAGAHLDFYLPNGLVRQYSIVSHDKQANRYTVAVKRDDNGRGGSKAMHELTVGTVLNVGRPRNNFVLYETAKRFVLVSGGIGITPMLHMANRLKSIGKPFELHVCARNESAVPFRDEIVDGALAANSTVHLDLPNGRSSFDVQKVFGRPDADTLIYLCGPQGFMKWLREAAVAAGWNEANVRIESFSAPMAEYAPNRAFDVELARTKRVINVKPDQSILDALSVAGVNVPYACMQGTCGTCVVGVVTGKVEHRDAFLSEDEKTSGSAMCLCVSRASGDKLTIDV